MLQTAVRCKDQFLNFNELISKINYHFEESDDIHENYLYKSRAHGIK
jgi:hypothetical protein